MTTLIPSPYGGKSLQDYDRHGQGGAGLSLQPHQGKWIVSQRGEAMGTVRRTTRKGAVHWDLDPHHPGPGRWTSACELAAKLLEEYIQEHARDDDGRNVPPAGAKKLILAIYKRFNVSDKMIRDGKHIVHFTGNYARGYGVDSYTNVSLEDLSPEDLLRAAKAVGIPS